MQIKMKESSVVKPAKETPKHTLRSSNLDLLVPSYHVPTIYFYKPDGSSNFFDTRLLKEALSNCLVVFYPVAGRLKRREEGGGGFDVDCNGEGVLFVEAESEGVIDDFGDFTPCFELQQLIPSSDESFSLPLLMLQVTYFKCGGASLGVGFQHTLVDGISAIHFINAWSDMTRGLSVTILPFLDRSLLSGRDPPSSTYHHTEYNPPPSMNNPIYTTKEPQTSPKLTSTATIKITHDQLNTLKANAKHDKNSKRYSTYETLAAHVWRCSCIARDLGDDQATKLYIATDGRSKLHPPLPHGYFGNVLFTATSLALSGDLRSKPLKSTAKKLRDALSRMDDDYLRSALDHLALQPDPTALVRGAHTFRCPNLNVVSWIRLPVHDADFGWGRPVHMGPAGVRFEGIVYILPSPTGDGSLSLVICLEADHMEVFKAVFYDF
ncbi:hypothetical protein RHSIM_Rhsim01G0027700 [Rhododendron simsii]|uniref:Uncharacterized protein n=1 Tax=Rhododendron simsii TaxID=118357 RepID=A0A834HIE7_RHOSS|nr:hypothetical protein RHSIM_Rhsim01G0027700 [Rhododendron simsii]